MSTAARIILKVRKEDKGRKIKFDQKKLPLLLDDWKDKDSNGNVYCDREGKSLCRQVTIKGDYIGIYCHWDGDRIGCDLKRYFNDYETILNLIVGGDCSFIDGETLRHYANNENYSSWGQMKPIQGTLEDVRKDIYGDYEYIFKKTRWSRNKC